MDRFVLTDIRDALLKDADVLRPKTYGVNYFRCVDQLETNILLWVRFEVLDQVIREFYNG
jgi:hypothetical protein